MKKTILLFCLCLLTALLPAQNDNILRITKIDSTEIALDRFWKFHNGDDSTWAATTFDDSNWDTVHTDLSFKKDKSNVFKGLAWFRLHIYIDSAMKNTPLCLLVDQDGASEIYIDGRLLHTLGKVPNRTKKEEKYNPNHLPLSFQYGKAGDHVLSVRYSNSDYQKYYDKYGVDDPGFSIKIENQDRTVETLEQRLSNTVFGVAIGVILLALGFVHLLFFLFYRKQRTNLYYSLFVFLFGLLFIFPTISANSSNPELYLPLNFYFSFLLALFFYVMLILHYSLFKRPLKKFFWLATAILIVTLILFAIKESNFSEYVLFSFIISTVIGSFFIVIKSIKDKIDGAWIIGTGSLLFLLFLGFIITNFMINNGNVSIHSSFLFIVIILALLSIPISMSMYLAREFALINNNLEQQFHEVKILSAKTIEQEKEKQKILESQNETLEIQVKERTSEIVEQKKVIEEKNKDITDSINYAKTIQEAILPPKELKNKLFPDSFILFKPKDIVSGDFYWFSEKNEKKIIASCDCTGHGVPGALMSMIGNNILNHIVNEKGITSPDEILNQLHQEIRKALKQEVQDETKDGMDISIVTFNSQTEIEFAGAQRPLWIIKKEELATDSPEKNTTDSSLQTDTYKLIEIKGNKFAIGGIQSETKRAFTKHQIALAKGDCLYLSSDGYSDQFSALDQKLMSSRFKELLISIQHKTMKEQELFLNDFIENWKGGVEQIDDILVIGIRI